MPNDLSTETAKVVYQPSHSGDGYAFGGGTFVVIGQIALYVGEHGKAVEDLAREIVRRWNKVDHDAK